jgi:hypothetical protein
MLDRRSGKNVIKTDFGGGITDDVSEIIIKIKTMEPMDAMKEANKVLKGEGRYKSLSKADRKKIVNDESVTDHIFERNIIDETEDFAQGGRSGSGLNYLLGEDDQNSRVPYAGGGFNKARRAFLKWAGAGAAGIGAAKSGLFGLLKAGKAKSVIAPATHAANQIIETPGMPYWFKPLVNKVIKEGEDVTKQFATKEREIVHQVSLEGKIGSPDALGVEDVRVTQSLDDGSVRVQYNSPDTIGESGVELVYKKGEWIEPTVGKKGQIAEPGMRTTDEFTAVEDDFYPQATSPDGDFDLEFTENVVSKVDDLYSDTNKLKQFATGKKLTKKEIAESIKKKKILKEINDNPNDHAFRNAPDYDPHDLDDFASGGRVPLAEGNTPSDTQLEQYYRNLEEEKKRRRRQKQLYEQRFGGPGPVLEAATGGLAGMLGE